MIRALSDATNAASRSAVALTEHVVPFRATDGARLNLIRVHAESGPTRGPVLLLHGAGVRAEIFRSPGPSTLVDHLAGLGYDVWLENWRASIDLEPRRWTLDEAAVHDHPAAVRTIVDETGAGEIKAVVHCQGSTSFMMSAVAGLVPEVSTVVSNAVSLHPLVPPVSAFKIRRIGPLVARLTPHMDPQWGLEAPTRIARALDLLVRATHHECDNPVCKWTSFTYGTGFPVLWRHENLDDAVHEWIKGEFAAVPFTFFDQMARCIEAGHLVAVAGLRELPADFLAGPPQTDARFAFLAGEHNRCFLPAGQHRTFRFFEDRAPGRHSFHVLPGYGHLDVFLGKDAARDVFPLIAAELER